MTEEIGLIRILLVLGLIIFIIGGISLVLELFGGFPWQFKAIVIGLLLILTASYIAKLNK